MKPRPSSISASELTWALALLVVALVLLDAAGGWFLRSIHPRSTVNPVYKATRGDPHTLILGGSTIKYSLDPAILGDGAYNAGQDGQTLFFAASFLRGIPRDAGTRRIIFGLAPHDFAAGADSMLLKYLKTLSVFAVDDPLLLDRLSRADPLIKLKYLSSLYPFQGRARRTIFEWLWPSPPDNGFQALISESGPAPAVRPRQTEPLPVPEESLLWLDQFIETSEELGLQIVFTVPPWVDEPNQASQPRYAKVMAAIRERMRGRDFCDLTAETPPEIERISHDTSYFYDRQHLNDRGAMVFSKVVSRQLKTHCGPVGQGPLL